MPDQQLYPVSITEPWPRQRNRWILVALVLGFTAAVLVIGFDRKRLDPIEELHLSGCIRSNLPWFTGKQAPYDFLELTSSEGTVLARPGDATVDIESTNGLAVSADAAALGVTTITKVHRSRALTERIRPFLKSYMYRACEFTAEFYNGARGDIILNPLDQRCPYWAPADELATNTKALTLAESLFPDTNAQNQAFVQTPRKIFVHLLQYEPDPETLAVWLSLPD